MTEKNTTVYGKQPEGRPIPLTARIDWMPDGAVIPLMYWTPEGGCYRVTRVSESTPIAFLKDRGEGLRFRVTGEMTENPEPCSDYQNTREQIYIYFADSFFSGKNFIDGRYGHPNKQFVHVRLDVFPDGGYELILFRLQDAAYIVEKTVSIEPHGSFSAGGAGLGHKVEARPEQDGDSPPRPVVIYFEVNKWFVELGGENLEGSALKLPQGSSTLDPFLWI